MNIQQFKYILALDETKHFEQAADKCFISQSTLSTMISKFEEELGIRIFDRKHKPVEVTKEGQLLLEQIKIINNEIAQLDELSKEIKGELSGDLSIAVIPTIAPFLLPRFLQQFANRFPKLKIQVREQTTAEIIKDLKSRSLDIGILSIPIKDPDILETMLYEEGFVYYNANYNEQRKAKTGALDTSNLCLLEEGHCMRTQVIELCELHKLNLKNTLNFDYKAGSIDSLLRFVNANMASTLLPYLATLDLRDQEKKYLQEFESPAPYREVGLAVHKHFVKQNILKELEGAIKNATREIIPENKGKRNALSPL